MDLLVGHVHAHRSASSDHHLRFGVEPSRLEIGQGRKSIWCLPWSPTRVPLAGATTEKPANARVMAYHGITYAPAGLSDPAIMPSKVEMIRQLHGLTMQWARIDTELPSCNSVRHVLRSATWGRHSVVFLRWVFFSDEMKHLPMP